MFFHIPMSGRLLMPLSFGLFQCFRAGFVRELFADYLEEEFGYGTGST